MRTTTWLWATTLTTALVGCLAGSGDGKAPVAVSASSASAATPTAASDIDARMDAAWKAAGLEPAPDVDDATFA
ncbi:MAG TPA: hypothetical protein VL400_21475, partial [Polyangiaceae bacterium]|nr:hypothetical protein [Polyangiaceae bacterium]